MLSGYRLAAAAAGALVMLSTAPACSQTTSTGPVAPGALRVRMVTDEADAVLAIVAKRQRGAPVTDGDWRRLFTSEGYRRLKEREEGMHRPFPDSAFRAFVLSDSTSSRAAALGATVVGWERADGSAAAARALAYLPAGTRLRATVFPVIKPRGYSFVWDTGTDSAAIFLYVDPAVTAPKLENTVAHALHHVGTAAACPDPADSTLAPPVRTEALWMGAFAEGLAVLAAAGGPDADPHAASLPAQRAVWARDFGRWRTDFHAVDAFFADVVEGRISPDSAAAVARTFYGEAQGPWYTIGYAMGSTVERTYGRGTVTQNRLQPAAAAAAVRPRRQGARPRRGRCAAYVVAVDARALPRAAGGPSAAVTRSVERTA